MYGYTGKILRVDLSRKEVTVEDTNKKWARKFIGGKGLGARYLFEELKPRINPLSPENILIYMTGPITGTTAPAFSRMAVITKSPLTGAFLDSYVGGFFPAELKFAGFDGIIIQGKSENLVYLFVEDDRAELRNGKNLMGKGVYETTSAIKKDTSEDVKVSAIGPAGEKKVKFACITFELHHNAGRGGAGAVMGSKNLKAVAVRGSQKTIGIYDRKEFNNFVKKFTIELLKNPATEWTKRGTPDTLDMSQEAGILPTRNFQEGMFEDIDKINFEAMRRKTFVKKTGCYACPLRCRNITKIRSGPYKSLTIEGPEYETLVLAGSNCGINSLEVITKFNSLCDDLGLDTISTGNIIAFAMECYQRGILQEKVKDLNLDLRFGQTSAYLKIPSLIANREGFGDMLADGVKKAAERISLKTKDFALEVKGLEYSGYDPRGSTGMALVYATSDRGADHMRPWFVANEAFGDLDPFTIDGKPKLVKEGQDRTSIKWSLISCDFSEISVEEMKKFYKLVTGEEPEDFMLIGERIWNLTRLFNVREGFTRADDSLPKRISSEILPKGPAKGRTISKEDFQRMLDEYYKLRGWTSEGIPNLDTLERLDLKDLCKNVSG